MTFSEESSKICYYIVSKYYPCTLWVNYMFKSIRAVDHDDFLVICTHIFEDLDHYFKIALNYTEKYSSIFIQKTPFFRFHSTLVNTSWMNVVGMTSIIRRHVEQTWGVSPEQIWSQYFKYFSRGGGLRFFFSLNPVLGISAFI